MRACGPLGCDGDRGLVELAGHLGGDQALRWAPRRWAVRPYRGCFFLDQPLCQHPPALALRAPNFALGKSMWSSTPGPPSPVVDRMTPPWKRRELAPVFGKSPAADGLWGGRAAFSVSIWRSPRPNCRAALGGGGDHATTHMIRQAQERGRWNHASAAGGNRCVDRAAGTPPLRPQAGRWATGGEAVRRTR